jgi:xylulokinase
VSLVGVDIGSSAVKAGAYRDTGIRLALIREAVPVRHCNPGEWEAEGDEVWAATVRVLRQLTAREAIQRDPPRAIAVSASGREVFPATMAGRPLGPCLRTGDARMPDPDAAVLLNATPEQWVRSCGHVPDHMDPTNRLLWWRQRWPKVWARARRFLNWHELLTLRLVGQAVTDQALAAGFLLYDLASGDWSNDRLSTFGIDRQLLPEILPWATPLGPIRRRVAGELGLPAACVMVVGSFDTSCAAVGAGAVTLGTPSLACGTWESLVAPAIRPRVRVMARNGFALSPHPSLPGSGVFARNPNGTAAVDWVCRLTGIRVRSLDERLAVADPGPSPVLAVPHLAGTVTPQGVRGGYGALLRLTLASSPIDTVRAVLEGIACELAFTLRALRRAGVAVDLWRASGGGARCKWWMQLKADLTGVPVEVVAGTEAGTLGAAFLAGLGTGAFGSLADAAQVRLTVSRRHEADLERGERYAERLRVQQRLVSWMLHGGAGSASPQ